MAKGRILINEERCKGCQLCFNVCPRQLIQAADHYNSKGYQPALFIDPDQDCTACTLCAMICPEAAITVFRLIKVDDREGDSEQASDRNLSAAA